MPVSSSSSHFPHRTNEDGIIDSICPHCFVTIGSSNCESDLEKMEAAHVCDPALVSYYAQCELKKQPPREDQPNSQRREIA